MAVGLDGSSNGSLLPLSRGKMTTKYGGHAAASSCLFQMPVHYPRYSKSDYENMPEWQLDRLLSQYALPCTGSLDQKKRFAMGAFLWD
ncbi:hypothetical protein DCAR_0626124 [Daucus carota subsp. sativus]|uniref:DUF7722 domain-containing protein n=1 Tax=Daucus carota subsp. sativus TaxID=79200 RepID=A0A164WVU2_DAUCS|nr:hypothetical protein DCAR_0626124 [Daucus carota subsp. sativus]